MNFYMLIVSDMKDAICGNKSGFAIAKLRLADKEWPLFKKTLYKEKIEPGDLCLIYVAGKNENSKCFISAMTVSEVMSGPYEKDKINPEKKFNKVLKFSETKIFEKPVQIKDIFDRLEFVKGYEAHWGRVLQGGCRKLSKNDYKLVVNSSL